jgi:DNA polymerase-3 subunit alpha
MYLLQITEINPLDFPMMMFERFVDPDRMDLPDVDVDFEPTRRDEVRGHLVRRYGENRVGNVGSYTQYRGKNSVNDVARVHSIPYVVSQKIKDMTPDEGFRVAYEAFPVVQDLVKQYPELLHALELEGNIKGLGMHAAGLVIGAEPLDRYVTTYTREVGVGLAKRRVKVLSVDKYDGEDMGLLKFDALGLTTMGEVKIMADVVGMSIEDVYRLPLDDDAVLNGFREGRTGGVFQFSGSTTRDICVEVAPAEFMDLAHINALSRPGPLHGGSTAQFIKARQGRTDREQMHPLIEGVLSATEGELVYQEQVIKLAQEVGGFDVRGAAKVRSIISKKKGSAAFAELWDAFADGALQKGVPAEEAKRVWRAMITSGGYAFNVAHAVSYSVLAYWTMWFRVHHPLAFFYARLLHAADAEATLTILKDMAASTEIKVMPLDPWFSQSSWGIDEGALRPGFRQVKGIGGSVAGSLCAFRDDWPKHPWISWADYRQVKGIGEKTIEILKDFADAEDPFGVQKLFNQTAQISDWAKTKKLPAVTKTSDMIPYREGAWGGVLLGVVQEIVIKDLFETHKNRTGEDLKREDVKDPHLATSADLYCEDTHGKFKVRVNRWAYPRYAQQIDAVTTDEDFVLAAVSKNNYPGKTTRVDQMWVITP